MGAKVAKAIGALTPLELVIREQPDHEQQIRLCMKKWHKRTTGRFQWPREGTFIAAYCDEVEANLKHHQAKDTTNSALAKRAREREVLRWFRQEGQRQVMSGAQMPVRSVGQNSIKEKHTTSGTTEKKQSQPSLPRFSQRLLPASDTGTSPEGQNVVRPGMKKEVQEKLKGELSGKLTATQAKETEEDTDSESSSDVSEISRNWSDRGKKQIVSTSSAHSRCPMPEPEINRREKMEIKRKGQHTDEERRLEHLLEQMKLDERDKMEKQKAATEAVKSYPLVQDIHPTPVTYSPPKPTCRSDEDQEQVTVYESETLQLSGIMTLANSCMGNLCRQLDYIEDTLHSLKNQQEDRSLNENKPSRHLKRQQKNPSRRRRKTQELTETKRMTLRSGKVLCPPHSPNNSESDSEDDNDTPKLMFSKQTRT